MVIDFLSRTETFNSFALDALTAAVRRQLANGYNLAAISDNEIIGYIGWLFTTKEQAEDWMEGRGLLKPCDKEHATAAALTIIASTDRSATTRLIRGARATHKDIQVYFKRGYDTSLKLSRKSHVLSTSYT